MINAGLPGASLSDELHHYLEIKEQVDPDIVLLATYLNDSQDSKRFYTRVLPAPYAYSRLLVWANKSLDNLRNSYMQEVGGSDLDSDWREAFRAGRDLRSGHLYEDPDAFDFEVYNAARDFGRAWNPKSWDFMEVMLGTLAHQVAHDGRTFAGFILPVHMQFMGQVENFFPQEQYLKICSSLGLNCFDPLPALRKKYAKLHGHIAREELMYDHCHYTARGNSLVVEAIFDWVKSLSPISNYSNSQK